MSAGSDAFTVYVVWVVVGLTAMTILTRGFFILPKRSFTLPKRIERVLKYAPIGALLGVIAPEILLDTALAPMWVKLAATIPAAAYYYWRKGILGTIVVGMAVFLLLRWWMGALG